MKSTHKVEVIKVHLEPHPNANSLSLVRIWNYVCVVRTADWKDGDLAAYIVPDSVVPDTPEYAFLDGHRRIRVRRFRGILSQGLLMKAPEGTSEGDDVSALMGVTRYEPPEDSSTGGEAERPPPGHRPCYDVESWHRYGSLFVPGEHVFVTEKIHGASGRFTFHDGRMHCGSRTEWKKESDSNLWWRCLRKNPTIETFCVNHPDWTLYGEVFGQVQDLRYGSERNDVFFAAFDVWNGGEWLDTVALRAELGSHVPQVPLLWAGPYDPELVKSLAEGPSAWPGADHVREGCCVRPARERTCPEIGRVHFKIVGNGYLERS